MCIKINKKYVLDDRSRSSSRAAKMTASSVAHLYRSTVKTVT